MEAQKWSPGGSVYQWSQIRIILIEKQDLDPFPHYMDPDPQKYTERRYVLVTNKNLTADNDRSETKYKPDNPT